MAMFCHLTNGNRPVVKGCYLTSAIRALPIMTSGIPLVYSRTLFLTQSAGLSLEANASSALSNMLMGISTSGPPSSKYTPEPLHLSHQGHEALSHASSKFAAEPRLTLYFLMLVNMVLPSRSATQELLRHCLRDRPMQHSTASRSGLGRRYRRRRPDAANSRPWRCVPGGFAL